MASSTTDRQFYMYLHCKPNGDPFYVGKGFGTRSQEFGVANDRNPHHVNVVNKYGRKNIGIFVFLCASEEQAFEDERRAIRQLRAEGFELANKTDGGEGVCGLIHSEQTKNKLSQLMQSKPPLFKGRRHTAESKALIAAHNKSSSQEVKAKISAASKGHRHTAQAKRKIGAASAGNKHNRGRRHTEELKEQLSVMRRGKPWSPKRRLSYVNAGNKLLGRRRSEDTRAKISAALKGKPWTRARRLSQERGRYVQ